VRVVLVWDYGGGGEVLEGAVGGPAAAPEGIPPRWAVT
jgi:hypothetical protein